MPTTSWNHRQEREAERQEREAERREREAERRRSQDAEERWVLFMLFGVSILSWVNLIIAAR